MNVLRIIKTIIVLVLLVLACLIGNELLNEHMISHDISSVEKTIIPNDDAVDINSADFNELCSIKYIGETTASNILIYREEIGRFENIEQIKNIEGISDKIFDAIKYDIRLGGE